MSRYPARTSLSGFRRLQAPHPPACGPQQPLTTRQTPAARRWLGAADRVALVGAADRASGAPIRLAFTAVPHPQDLAWRAHSRRFDLEHTVRFAKQALGWATPRPRHPAQADRWTWLVLAGYTQLRLARAIATDRRLPWERPRLQPRLSPYRVRRGFPRLLCTLGSPASASKPFGCSPGRPTGRASGPATRYPAIERPAGVAVGPRG